MKSKTEGRKPDAFLFHKPDASLVDESSASFRMFSASIARDLQRLEQQLASFQRPESTSIWQKFSR